MRKKPTQNSGKAAGRRSDGMPIGTPFPKGVSGNPGGRPKGIASKVRELTGDDGDKLVALAWRIADGRLTVTRLTPDGVPVEIGPTVKERLDAIEYLTDRGHGRAPQEIHLKDEGERAAYDLTRLTLEQVREWRRLQLAARVHDGTGPGDRKT